MALTYDVNQRDYGFRRDGTYSNAAPRPFNLSYQRRAPRRDAGWGRPCPGCGLSRSVANVCDCNAG